jgi:hypothetical protein
MNILYKYKCRYQIRTKDVCDTPLKNITRHAQSQKTGKPNNLKVFWSNKTQRPKQIFRTIKTIGSKQIFRK